MNLTAKQYAKTLFEVLQETDQRDFDKVLDNFAIVLANNNDLALFDEIAIEYDKYSKDSKILGGAGMTNKHNIDLVAQAELIEKLNNIISDDMELKQQFNDNMYGGVAVKLDDESSNEDSQ